MIFENVGGSLTATIVDIISAHLSNPNKIESSIFGIATLSHFIMTPTLFATLKHRDEELDEIVNLMIILSKETPLLSGMGMKFALKSKTRMKWD